MKTKHKVYIAILAAFVVFDLVLCYFAFIKPDKLETKIFKNDYLEFKYTEDYGLKERESKLSLGKDKKSGQIDIVITELTDEMC